MRKRVFALFLILCLPLAACGTARGGTAARTRTVFAMDTVMNLAAYGGNGDAALDAAERELHRLDALLARGTEGSAVYTLNHEGTVIDAETAALLRACGAVAQATGGAFDPTLAEALALWGFGNGAGEHRVPAPEELGAALARAGEKHLHIDGEQAVLDLPAQIDLGGVAKGYAGERVCARLAENGVTGAAVDLGGDVALLGAKPDGARWRVAVKDPADGGAYLGVLETDGGRFVMTSGVYERYFEENGVRYHHILDPKTGYPADSGLVSATVICESGVWADALATACCVLGADGALELRERLAPELAFDLILVTDGGETLYTCADFAPAEANGYSYRLIGGKEGLHG